jgi:hypothetical protein
LAADGKEPDVFISYSHDSKDHKKWVIDLASALESNGVRVRLDQWDVEFGDDLPRYMQEAVTNSDRVLVICTPTYKRKAEAGIGGLDTKQ